jgi:hypothetical protein
VSKEDQFGKYFENLSDRDREWAAAMVKLRRASRADRLGPVIVMNDLWIEILKNLATAQPFKPFTIKFSSGVIYEVPAPNRTRFDVGRGDFVLYFDNGTSQVFRGWEVEEIYKTK